MKDFKGMNLMSIAGKVYNKMQLNSIYEPTNIQLTSYVPFKQDLGRVETVWSKFIYWKDFSKLSVNVNYLY